MGMHQVQRQELRQALVQQQVLMMPGDGVEHFRTDEEKAQVSQYEILKQIGKIVESGEFFDDEHFGLEINRQIFGHPLEARLGNFGRDIENLVRLYGGNEEVARETITLLGKQKEERERKDIPGQIASSWFRLSSSEYLAGESEEKRLPNLIHYLSDKDADIAKGLDIVAKAAEIAGQRELVFTSLNRLANYADQDPRIIPFTHSVLSPVFRAIKSRNETLNQEESRALYSYVVETLYMLDRELRVSGSIENISEAIKNNGVRGLITQMKIPLPLQVSLERLTENPELKTRIIELCNDADFIQGRELKRKIYTGFSSLEELDNHEGVLTHIVNNVGDSKGLGRVLGALSLVSHDRDFVYPYDVEGEDKILRNLRLQLTDKSVKRLGLDDETLEKYLERLESDERFQGIGKIVTTLAGYSHYQNEQQTGLLREIVSAELAGKFTDYRYSHDRAESQLKVLDKKTDSWRKNSNVKRLVGELDKLQAHIASIRNVAPKFTETYKDHYHQGVDKDLEDSLREQIEQNEEALRSGNLDKKRTKEVGYETSLLREQLTYSEIIRGLQELTTDNYQSLFEKVDHLAKKRSKNPLYHKAVWMRDTLDQPVYRDAQRIEVFETDDLEALLRMGEKPIPHCQDWRSNSSLNGSLLSFVADANKKLYHIRNGNERPVGMSLVRLVDWDNHPTLLIENIYANEWSTDYGVALIGSLADKAAAISEETGKVVRVASPDYSGHADHTTNVQVKEAFERFSEQYKVYINQGRIDIKPPKSKCKYEYWDCGPGKVESGSSINIGVSYIEFGKE